MFAIIGIAVVSGSIILGYLLEHGNLSVLVQPAELIIIGGAACGAFIIASPAKVIKAVINATLKVFKHKPRTKDDYIEALMLLNGIFYKIRQQGLVSIESDVDNPAESPLFSQYPGILHNHHAVSFIADTLRTVMTTTIAPHELESLIDSEIETLHEEMMQPSHILGFIADSLPGLGIVAAVLGVVITMGKINEPPAVLGHSVGAALVGTFLGVLMCYGYVGPLSKNMAHMAGEDLQYLNVLKVAMIAFIGGGSAPKVAVEFGRRVIPSDVKPSFAELEESFRLKK